MSEAAAFHCPHCGGTVPEPAEGAGVNFCPTCGRRVEGWKTGYRASVGGAKADVATPGLEEPTMALAPSPALLRQAISPPTKKGTSPLALVLMVGGTAAAAVLSLVVLDRLRHTPQKIVETTPAITLADNAPSLADEAPSKDKPQVIDAPAIPPTNAPGPVPWPTTWAKEPAPKPDATAPVATKNAPPLVKPPLVKPPVVVTKAAAKPASEPPRLVAVAPKPGPSTKGGLPHKASGKTDSHSTDSSAQPSGTGLVVSKDSAPPALVAAPGEEATPMTPDDRRHEDASRADASNVQYVVQAHLPQVQACYGRAFKDSSPGGRVEIAFVVGANGKASHLHTESNATHSSLLSSCLEQRIAEWQFPRPASGEFELIYPFVFSPGS